jgi:hypothetical protein
MSLPLAGSILCLYVCIQVPHGHGLGHDSFVHKGRVYFEPKVPGAPLQTKTAIAGNGGYDTRLIS